MATRGWEGITDSDMQRIQHAVQRIQHAANLRASAKPAKYRNVRCEWNGEKFDSKAEMEWFLGLKARETAGEIRQLQRQVPMPLYAPIFTKGLEHNGAHVEVARYIADAVYYEQRGDHWVKVVADRKSKITRTALYKLKAKWLLAQEGIEILEVL